MKTPLGLPAVPRPGAWRACAAALVALLAVPHPRAGAVTADEAPLVLPGSLAAPVHALDITLNAKAVGTWEVLEHQGGYWADLAALKAWRLLMPAHAKPLFQGGRLWWPLFALPGYRAAFDHAQQTLVLEVVADAFESHQVTSPRSRPLALSPALSALMLNYDLAWTESSGGSARQSDRGLLTEWGWTSASGVLLSTHVNRWQRVGDNETTVKGARLETSWTRDWPDQALRLRLGDSWTTASSWGRQAAFGGIQLSSKRLMTGPGSGWAGPILTGSALTPSTVELYVNDVLRQSVQVPAGPFSLGQTAPVSGAGEARLVVRDVLGRETTLSRPFYTSPMLLAPQQQDWSLEAGRLRRGFGIDTPQQGYDHTLAQAWLRRGMSERITLEARAQGGAGLANLGASLTASAWDRALVEAAWAGSSMNGLNGASGLIGVQHQGLRQWLSLRAQGSSRDYTEAGRAALERSPKLEVSATWRTGLDGGSNWGVTLAALRRHDGSEVNTGSLSFTQRLTQGASLLWSASRVAYTGWSNGAAGASPSQPIVNLQALLVMPLERPAGRSRTVVTAQWLRPVGSSPAPDSRQASAYLGVSAPPDIEAPWGWRMLGGQRTGRAVAEGGVYRQMTSALVGLDAWSAEGGSHALRGLVQGAWVWAEGRVFSAPRLKDSFALVEVPGQGGVGVSLDGPVLTRTDARGLALVPRLTALQESRIRLDANDLATETEIDTMELTATAPWRSGVKLRFPVQPGRAALLFFTVAGDGPAPAGALITLEGDAREFMVGSGGRAYVTGLHADQPHRVRLKWRDMSCEVEVRWRAATPPDTPAPGLPRLGPWHCPEVQP